MIIFLIIINGITSNLKVIYDVRNSDKLIIKAHIKYTLLQFADTQSGSPLLKFSLNTHI
jgi:hypothetical protein